MPRRLRTHKFRCQWCGQNFERTNRQPSSPRFCGQSCSNHWQFANGRLSSFSEEFQRQKYGDDVVDQRKATLNYTFACEECGATVTKRKRNPLPRFCSQRCKGKHNVRFRRAWTNADRNAASQRMIARLNAIPEGVYSWPTLKGWYKGLFFRSSYEYLFLKQLESDGLSLNQVQCGFDEHIYYEFKGKQCRYVPDFFVPSQGIVYEVKSTYAIKNDPKVELKARAASDLLESRGLRYRFITEDDLNVPNNVRQVIEDDLCAFLMPQHVEDDRWQTMFEQQDGFMKLLQQHRNFPDYPVDLSVKNNQRLVKDIAHDCMHELFEAIHLLKNSKAHRATDIPELNRAKFVEELADALHYMIEIFILIGISPKEAYYAFMNKGTINFDRILNQGY